MVKQKKMILYYLIFEGCELKPDTKVAGDQIEEN